MKLSTLLLPCLATVFVAGAPFGCSVAQPEELSSDEDPTLAALLPVEDTAQYANCRDNGHSSSTMDLGQLNPARMPQVRAAFTTAGCIVGRLTQFEGVFRPYNLQSFKLLDGEYRFFFKRVSTNVVGEKPSQCLKIKMTAFAGPTDVFVTITRVKQLPPPRADGLCADGTEI